MSGRFALTRPPKFVRDVFGYVEQPDFPPRYNIAPTQPIAIVRRDPDSPDPQVRHFRLVRWGFVPSFVKDFSRFRPFVNARAEDIAERPSFRNAFRRRRCLVPADGYYLWRRHGRNAPEPFVVRHADSRPFGMAGLVETWVGADGSELDTACLITRAATGGPAAVVDRMPVVVEPAAFDMWLDPDERLAGEAGRLLRAATADDFETVPISPAVNSAAHDHPTIQTPTGRAVSAPAPEPPQPGPRGRLF